MERKSQPRMQKQKDYFFIIDKIGIVIFTLLNASIQRALLLQINNDISELLHFGGKQTVQNVFSLYRFQ